MSSNLKKMKELISNDKRVCERLDFPLHIRYSRSSDGAGVSWSDEVVLDNIGGAGLGFSDDIELAKGEQINVELKLPCEKDPFYLGAEVMWVSRNFKPDADEGVRAFSYGLKIFKLDDKNRQKFEQFISDKIIDKYLDDQGELRDVEE